MTTLSSIPADTIARERALGPEQSFIVRAPAGSGKTDLLTRRFLKLLATVDEPEEILAITFTRAATAEMRARVLGDLEKTARAESTKDAERDALARAALAHSETRRWSLLEQPHRLNIETIDSLCLRIAHNQPLLSRMGGRLSPIDDAGALYAEAARRTLGRLGSADSELEGALMHLLELRDNNLPDCERLVAVMLAQRDQWIRAFPLTGKMSEEDWEQARSRLERPFREAVKRAHSEAYRLIMTEPLLASELVSLAQYACDNGYTKVAALAGMRDLPPPELVAVEHWRCIADFLLTNGGWRKAGGLKVSNGFPPEGKRQKERMGLLLDRLQGIPNLREAFCAVRELPEPGYDDSQWRTLRSIFLTLRRAVAELRVIFAEQNKVDFTELGLAAREVLRSPEAGDDVLLALSGTIRHLLVDEFQDTSRSQHELLRLLIRAWGPGDGRSCFLVGDPMQSIYLFRQAEVELFEQVTRGGLASDGYTVEFEPVELLTNFRSHGGLTLRWNEMFGAIFNSTTVPGIAAIKYSPTIASDAALPGDGVHIYPQFIPGDDPAALEAALRSEAEQVCSVIARHREQIERAIQEGSEYRVAVLVRSRLHLAGIVALLREGGVAFRAVELETLNERQELLDLLSLIRALLHPMDRVAWLSVLRAPWCGLTLPDLHALTGADDPAFRNVPMLELIESRANLLTAEGETRLQRTAAILTRAIAARFSGPYASSFSQWIERTWRSLGGPQCVDGTGYENAQVFFTMLDSITPDGMECLNEDIEDEMERLYAQPDPDVSERAGVQLMTIHKAKGLGFDVVIVPGLDRRAAQDAPPLISSLQRSDPATGETEMLVAPIGYRGDDKHPTYRWVQRQRRRRGDEELKRLLYVACTRARRSLHLLGTATVTASGLKPGDSKSLLATGWPALRPEFEAAYQPISAEQMTNVVAFPERSDKGTILDIAAAAESPLASERKLLLRRLRGNADLASRLKNVDFAASSGGAAEPEWARPEGSRDARLKGSVVHALLEQLSRGVPAEFLGARARLLLRASAYSGKGLEDALAEVLDAVKNCLSDPDGAWILQNHPRAQSEASWTGWKGRALETLRADRVFLAGGAPCQPGEDHLWIVDYKMSAPAGSELFLAEQRGIYAPQLERYARAVREAQGIDLPVCFGLYYPRIARLDWWRAEEA